jgi:bacterioferritin-associated ferredoxin
MYVCLCVQVTDSQIKRAISHGASSIDDIGDSCGAGTCCGSCHDHIQAILDYEQKLTSLKKLK